MNHSMVYTITRQIHHLMVYMPTRLMHHLMVYTPARPMGLRLIHHLIVYALIHLPLPPLPHRLPLLPFLSYQHSVVLARLRRAVLRRLAGARTRVSRGLLPAGRRIQVATLSLVPVFPVLQTTWENLAGERLRAVAARGARVAESPAGSPRANPERAPKRFPGAPAAFCGTSSNTSHQHGRMARSLLRNYWSILT